MNSEYCISCGKKSFFESSKPAFCGFCQKPFNRADSSSYSSTSNPSSAKTTSSSKAKRSLFVDSDDEDDEDEFVDLQLNKRELAKDFEIEIFQDRPQTFEDLAIHGASPRRQKEIRPEFKPGADIIAVSHQECARVQVSKEVS